MITIIQGESFPILISLKNGKEPLKPKDVADLMVCLDTISKKHSDGDIKFIEESEKWEFFPTQEDTKNTTPGFHSLWVTIKYAGGIVRKLEGQRISVKESKCEAVLLRKLNSR